MRNDTKEKKAPYNLTTQKPLRSCDVITLSTICRTDPTAKQAEAKCSCVYEQTKHLSFCPKHLIVRAIRSSRSGDV